jgi:sugar lactone lactonase YvrE
MRAVAAEPALDEIFEIAEGPCWSPAGELTWVDVLRGTVLAAEVRQGAVRLTRRFELAGPVSAALPRGPADDGWLLAAGTGFAHLGRDGTLTKLAQPEARESGVVRMNDAKCDPLGRLWAGSMGFDEQPGHGSLFRVDLDGSVERVLDHTQQVANGMAWSPDGGTFYLNDSGHGVVYRADYDLDRGLIGALTPFAVPGPGEGAPDGMTIDDEGMLWVALWRGSAVHRYDPSGRLVQRVAVPAHHTTSCCLGGPDRRTLFVTSAELALTEQQLAAQPDSGRLFAAEVEVPGPPTAPFLGALPAPDDDNEETH